MKLFIQAYGGVIEGGTLSVRGNETLLAVEKVTFEKGSRRTAEHVPFSIRWEIQLKDGRTLKAEAEPIPDCAGDAVFLGLQTVYNGFVPPPEE